MRLRVAPGGLVYFILLWFGCAIVHLLYTAPMWFWCYGVSVLVFEPFKRFQLRRPYTTWILQAQLDFQSPSLWVYLEGQWHKVLWINGVVWGPLAQLTYVLPSGQRQQLMVDATALDLDDWRRVVQMCQMLA